MYSSIVASLSKARSFSGIINAIYYSTFKPSFTGIIPLNDLKITYMKSSGPGGQNVNKLNTKVEIRFDIESSTWIPDAAKEVMKVREANRINKVGEFFIASDRTRQQILNQADCLDRIRRIVRDCEISAYKPEPTPEELAQKVKREERISKERISEKRAISSKKRDRGPVSDMNSLA